MAVLDVVVTSARDEDRARLYGQLSASLHPIYFPVYVYVEGKPCDETLCTKFIDSLNVAAPSTTRYEIEVQVVYEVVEIAKV